ncbi:MAG: ABC transporter substrate-binding protein [Candidatus Methanomethylophilaceae archaeon]|nr:ABC transporter substrate-binding protein [Candidatus Methanomethylophilaceae archaeon]
MIITQKGVLIAVIAAAVIVVVAAAVLMSPGGEKNSEQASDTIHVTDAVGRQVDVPKGIDSVCLDGKGMVLFMSMFDPDLIKYTNSGTVSHSPDRTFTIAYDFSKRTDIKFHSTSGGKGAVMSTEDVESIAKSDVDVVFVSKWNYESNKSTIDTLAKSKPVVVIDNSDEVLWESNKLAAHLEQCIGIIGKTLGMEKRSKELVDGINKILAEQKSLIGTQTKKVYYGGTQGQLNKTYGNGAIFFDNVGVTNAYVNKNTTVLYGTTELTVEEVTNLGMDTFILQPSCYNNIQSKNAQDILRWLYTVNNDGSASNDVDIFTILPHASGGATVGCILGSGFALESLVYGTCTIEKAKQKFDEVMHLFWGDAGANMLDKMNAEYKTLTATKGCDMPYFEHLKVGQSGDYYVLLPAGA